MNPYSAPSSDLVPGERGGPSRGRLFRAFAVFHAGLTVVLLLLSLTMIRQGLSRLRSLDDPAWRNQIADPDRHAEGVKTAATSDLATGLLLLAAVAVGVVLVNGLWRRRRWSRPLAMAQVVLFGATFGTSWTLRYEKFSFEDVYPYFLPIFLLGLFTLLLWLPRYSALVAPAGGGPSGPERSPQ